MHDGEPEIDSQATNISSQLPTILKRRALVGELLTLSFLGGLGHALASYPITLERFPHRFTCESLKLFLAHKLQCQVGELRLEVMIHPDKDNPCTICMFQNPGGNLDCQIFLYPISGDSATLFEGNMEVDNQKYLIDREERDRFIQYAKSLPKVIDFGR